VVKTVIQHEFYTEFLAARKQGRDVESDACGVEFPEEKEYKNKRIEETI